MDKPIKQLSSDFANLPEEVRFYYSSEISGRQIKELADKYHLEIDSFYDLIFEVINSNFDFSATKEYIQQQSIPALLQENFWADFIGRLFLPIESYLDRKDIRQKLMAVGGKPEKYEKYVQDFYKLIEDENWRGIDKILEAYESIDKDTERSVALELLANDLVDILKAPGTETGRLNGIFIYLLNIDQTFKSEASRILLENKLKITSKPLIIAGKNLDPTVANWLNDFILFKGSGMFESLDLADYLIKNPNVKALTEKEKLLIRSLLDLYRNLVFFPESHEKVPLEERAIFPIKHQEKKVIASVGQQRRKPILREDDEKKSELISKSTDAVGEEDARVRELEVILGHYDSLTLEYKAIKQEIERLRAINLKKAKSE